MKKLTVLFILLITNLLSFSTFAKNNNPCNAQDGGVQAGYLCVQQKMAVADKHLNTAYQQAIKRIKEEQTALREGGWSSIELEKPFRSAQRAWLKFRDAECAFTGASATPSSWSGVHVEQCKLDMTLERVRYFKTVFVG